MKTIPLTQGKVALVDDDDLERLDHWHWSAHALRRPNGSIRTWYAVRNKRGAGSKCHLIYMHCQILGIIGVDHRDGDGLNNQRYNLRPATKRQNNQNKVHKRAGCSSRFKGVSWSGRPNRLWQVCIADGPLRPNGRAATRSLGRFATEEEAARAYDAAARESFGEFAALNFP